MADISYLNLHENDVVYQDPQLTITIGSIPYWDHEFDALSPQISDFPQITTVHDDVFSESGSGSDSIADFDLLSRENQVNFVIDLFHQRVEQSHVMGESDLISEPVLETNFRVFEGNDDGENPFGLELGLGFDRDENCGFMFSDCGEEFVVERRVSGGESSNGSSIVFDSVSNLNPVRVCGFCSDSDEDDEVDLHSVDDYGLNCDDHDHVHDDGEYGDDDDGEASIRLCWDAFNLEDNRDNNEEFEWEEVDARVDEREVLSMVIDGDEGSSIAQITQAEDSSGEMIRDFSNNIDWEILLNVDNSRRISELEMDGEAYLEDHDDSVFGDSVYAYDMLFGQFGENENASMGRPPASRSVVESLPMVVLTQKDVENNNVVCAVCKDDMNVGEQAKQMPCSHKYHGECIVPWLGIRNTCPVCRHELPTDDPNYEQARIRRI